jgi:polyhydroxyalkanoate synthesis regulator protein
MFRFVSGARRRLHFMEHRDGLMAAMAFARQVISSYGQACIAMPMHPMVPAYLADTAVCMRFMEYKQLRGLTSQVTGRI